MKQEWSLLQDFGQLTSSLGGLEGYAWMLCGLKQTSQWDGSRDNLTAATTTGQRCAGKPIPTHWPLLPWKHLQHHPQKILILHNARSKSQVGVSDWKNLGHMVSLSFKGVRKSCSLTLLWETTHVGQGPPKQKQWQRSTTGMSQMEELGP